MTSGVNVELDTVKMREVAKTVESQMNIIRNCYDSIGKDALSLFGTQWEGASADAYYHSMKILCHEDMLSGKVTAGHIVGILKEYTHDLSFTADEYDRNEGRLTDRVERLPDSVFGV